MTFLEACYSGKKFRHLRMGKDAYWIVEHNQPICRTFSDPSYRYLIFKPEGDESDTELLSDLVSNDFEFVKE